MKSAFELAMEKYGGEPVKKLTDSQKAAIAEIESRYQAKIAEAKVMHQDRLKKTMGERSLIEQLENDLAVELASINEKLEWEKNKIRDAST